MIDKRLFRLTDKTNLFKLVIARLLNLVLSIFMWLTIAKQLANYLNSGKVDDKRLVVVLIGVLLLKSC